MLKPNQFADPVLMLIFSTEITDTIYSTSIMRVRVNRITSTFQTQNREMMCLREPTPDEK
jgi:hypothetical protein